MGTDYRFTIDSEEFRKYPGIKINYSNRPISPDEFWIKNHSLLFDFGINEQEIDSFSFENSKAFFKVDDGHFPFDIFAASFYLISRFEEYLPHTKDMYGRFSHQNSLAFKEGFLHQPVINIWANTLALTIENKFPEFKTQSSKFKTVLTYDIDMAFSYKHKGFIRFLGGFIKAPSLNRIAVLLGFKKDPFDVYAWMDELHKKNSLQPIYFFLVAEKNGPYDKNILPHKNIMWKLIKHHAKKYNVGIHPSWQSGDRKKILSMEIEQLEDMSDKTIDTSRQHYIRFNFPEGYKTLLEAGIKHDYSMGYGSINGFRASVAAPFYWYNLETEQQTHLRIHPFCFMDANSFYEQNQSPQSALEELMYYQQICKEVDGTFICIWHNNFLGTAKEFKGWREIYEQFITLLPQPVSPDYA